MKPSFLLGVAVGYVLGARAGRERYEDIVALGRRIAGSQTIQSTAGVVQAQASDAAHRAIDRISSKVPMMHGHAHPGLNGTEGADGHNVRY